MHNLKNKDMGKFQIKKRSNDEFQFNLKAANGEIILTSEGYKTKAGCDTGIASVKKNAIDDSKYDKLISKNNKHYFNLKAGNGEIIGTSEMYESIESRDGGIDSVKRNAPIATIDDQTS
jgi:uncharacterized protein